MQGDLFAAYDPPWRAGNTDEAATAALYPSRILRVGLVCALFVLIMMSRSREKIKKSFKAMSAELVQLRVEVAALRNIVSEVRPVLSVLPPSVQARLKDYFESIQ